MAMSYSQVKDHCNNINVQFPKNATRSCMIHLILVAEPPQIPTQDSVHDFVDSLCNDIANDRNMTSVSLTGDETSISSVKDTSHQPQPQTQQNMQQLPYPSRFGALEAYQPLSFPHSHYNLSKQPSHSQPLIDTTYTSLNVPQQPQPSASVPNQMNPNALQNLQCTMNRLLSVLPQAMATANNNVHNIISHPTHPDSSQSDEKQAADPVLTKEICYHFNGPHGCNRGRSCLFLHRRYVYVLREYASVYYQSTDVNVKNIGIYLKNSLDGYVKIDDQENPGYIKYGTYARTFCEVATNYMLKEKSVGLTLYRKTQELARHPKFPRKEMDFIRLSTNKIIHGVAYNEFARNRYIAKKDQKKILIYIYKITRWVNQQINKQ
eukprot:213347_1